MIAGKFGDNGELLFTIELITANQERFLIEALLDTGFTTGYLAINSQDIEVLEWSLLVPQIEMQTARGIEFFDIYEGKVIFAEREFIIPVHASEGITDVLIGSRWLEIMQLLVNKARGILTLEMIKAE